MNDGIYIGCAGWSIPKAQKPYFPACGSHLERYASVFNAVEINSSFYRSHRRATYERWAGSVPDEFRFSAKVPKAITHGARLEGGEDMLRTFLDEVGGLGGKLGCLLIQLPPSLAYRATVARAFFALLRDLTDTTVVLEARHADWFDANAGEILRDFQIVRVHADPPAVAGAEDNDLKRDPVYYRLHGKPKIYYSKYPSEEIQALAARIAARREAWCIFDNTALGHALENARELLAELANG
jgi:uncharacterized protein YecE (DUF72 family)